MIQKTKYTYRFLARFVIEAKTPIAIGSGQKSILSDSLVALDVNGLPYIPGTTLAGVVRSILDPCKVKEESNIFGFQKKVKNKSDNELKGKGSEILFSEGRIMNSHGDVVDDIVFKADLQMDELLREYLNILPVRQHVCINDQGTAKDGGKFDQQVVFAGTRFCFEVELISDGNNKNQFQKVINAVNHRTFRLGGGSRKGYGEIQVITVQTAELNLKDAADFEKYLNKSSNMSEPWTGWGEKVSTSYFEDPSYHHYEVTLSPVDFMLFGAGFGDEQGDANITSVKARQVVWKEGEVGKLESEKVLIPASSLKGALRHRVAYHYNKKCGRFVDNFEGEQPKAAEQNEAVCKLFGSQDGDNLQAGMVLFSDVIMSKVPHKPVTHVSIDRFTGGAMNGFLFTEEVDYAKGRDFTFDIYVDKRAYSENDENICFSFEESLRDICRGMLPLGGGVNRGNGVFTGSIRKDGEDFYESK